MFILFSRRRPALGIVCGNILVLTLLKMGFSFYIELTMEKSYRVPKGLNMYPLSPVTILAQSSPFSLTLVIFL